MAVGVTSYTNGAQRNGMIQWLGMDELARTQRYKKNNTHPHMKCCCGRQSKTWIMPYYNQFLFRDISPQVLEKNYLKK